MKRFLAALILFSGFTVLVQAQQPDLSQYNVVWTSQSKNSGESMPCGGGDIGVNVWVENNELLFYLSRSGAFDENNLFPKFGRIRIRFSPGLLDESRFRQELKLKEGYVEITGKKEGKTLTARVWVDVYRPVVHVETESSVPVSTEVFYESWRTRDLVWTNSGQFNASRGYMGAPVKAVIFADSIYFEGNTVQWYHRNRDESIFDLTVKQQGLDPVKDKLWNPLKNLTFGGVLSGDNMKPEGTVTGKYADTGFTGWKLRSVRPARKNHVKVYLHIDNTPDLLSWKNGLAKIVKEADEAQKTASLKSIAWWNEFWNRSYIAINQDKADSNSPEWQVGRNYQLFRYQLGCNAYGKYPTKFNGGLFTYDPVYVSTSLPFTPDHRNWGGGTFTAQNQRLVYFPMFKSGDTDMLPAQLGFYLRALGNAELRTEFYWGHKGASFTELIEQFGLPVAFEYGWNRPENAQ